ncbi:hypothetical protein K469DRAFT_793295 [Zopfia rhizophila CBS 207.26]|uniref:PHD-type domain-containing protein n=1 Tax=Zopfia rhizophila CBS 207.26 TaxID=1314779 RepID=A0A6A6DN12_9PEZI|nr:hypothetical protein K469DRAFT_793295 [Zopfia rhizophila CBS 207.26]
MELGAESAADEYALAAPGGAVPHIGITTTCLIEFMQEQTDRAPVSEKLDLNTPCRTLLLETALPPRLRYRVYAPTSPKSSTMPSNDSLEAHGIYFRVEKTLESVNDCPEELRDLFEVILCVHKRIEFQKFGGQEANDLDPPLIEFTARQQYEKELKKEASDLQVFCSDPKRSDDVEATWVETLGPIVFYRFNRELEETFICRKHFPIRGRPLIARSSERKIAERVEKWSEDSEMDLCRDQEHLNLPNFDTAAELAYPGFENEGTKIPDRTFGLLSYDLNEWLDVSHMGNDRVRLFDQALLRRLEEEEYLKPPFSRHGTAGKKRVREMHLHFPFALWEVKRKGGGYDHQSAQTQNAVKVKKILEWQYQTSQRAKVPWEPLVWYFISVGSDWTLHACHFQQNLTGSKRRVCLHRKLWSGDSANDDDALQLLYLVDIIALWGEHQYKPFAGACIRRLQAECNKEEHPPLETTLLRHQMKVNPDTFPWLGREQNSKKPRKPRSQSQSRSQDAQSPQFLRELEHLSLTSHERDYIIPERDSFIWLLDRDLEGEDLLIVRVNDGGSVLPPLLIFDPAEWKDPDFRYIIEEEEARTPEDVLVDFRFREDGSSYVKRSVVRDPGYFRKPQSQFCAILPLDPETYKRQRSASENQYLAFGPLEEQLRLPQLIKAAHTANERWCTCQAIYNEYSPSMIRCDNLTCPMGWYHKKCVNLDENFEAERWFCKQCLKKWHRGINLDEYESEEIDEDMIEASECRVHRMKTFARVWKEHQWPDPEDARNLIDRLSCQINISERRTYSTIMNVGTEVDNKLSYESRCWAITRSSPKVMRAVKPVGGIRSSGTNRTARNLEHRKSTCDVPNLNANSRMPPRQTSDRLSIPRRRDL